MVTDELLVTSDGSSSGKRGVGGGGGVGSPTMDQYPFTRSCDTRSHLVL